MVLDPLAVDWILEFAAQKHLIFKRMTRQFSRKSSVGTKIDNV
jgi:hypothetical protein